MSRERKSKRKSHMARDEPVIDFSHSSSYTQVLWSIFLHPRSSYENVIETLIQAIPGAIKRKEPRCITRFQCPTKSYSWYWSKIMGFLSFSQGLEDLHIQKDTMSMPYMNTMEEFEGIPWRIARPSKTRFNPWSMQIRSNLENLSVVIRSIKIKDQLGAVFVCLLIMNVFIRECTFWKM